MRLNVQFSAPVARTDLHDYLRHLEITVTCDDEGLDEYMVGKLAMAQILWADAQTDGVSLFEVGDNDSQEMHDVHFLLTKGQQEFRPHLQINDYVSHVLVLLGAVLHPSLHAYRQGILDAAFTLFGADSLAVMAKDSSALSKPEWAALGFRKIPRSDLLLRHSARRSKFRDDHPTGQDTADAVAEPKFEKWVLREWKRLCGPTAEASEE
jgi:hypothetical protein